jgi:hypothetical protein
MNSSEVQLELELEIDECPICAHDLEIHVTTQCCRQKIHRKCLDDSFAISNGKCPFCRTIHSTVIIVNNPFSVVGDLREQGQYLRRNSQPQDSQESRDPQDTQQHQYEIVHQSDYVHLCIYFKICILFSFICMILVGLGIFPKKKVNYDHRYYYFTGRYIDTNMSTHNISITNYTL